MIRESKAVEWARAVLKRAREASGAAAYAYFFKSGSEEEYERYLDALAAEVEAEAALDDAREAARDDAMVEALPTGSGRA